VKLLAYITIFILIGSNAMGGDHKIRQITLMAPEGITMGDHEEYKDIEDKMKDKSGIYIYPELMEIKKMICPICKKERETGHVITLHVNLEDGEILQESDPQFVRTMKDAGMDSVTSCFNCFVLGAQLLQRVMGAKP